MLGVALALGSGTPRAEAAVSSASIDGDVATLNLDGADDTVTVSADAGLLVHSVVGGGLESNADWDSATPKVQTLPADGTVEVVLNGGAGNDTLTVLGSKTALAGAVLDGGAGDDFLAGAETDDRLSGGDGNDTLVGRPGTDLMSGGAGNDTFEWNNGDGSDRQDGDTGDDTTVVNGDAALGDVFTLDAVPGGVRILRTNLVPVKIDAATERFQINGLGGNDSITAGGGVGAVGLLSIDGGADDDTVDIRDNAPELASGGDGRDTVVADSEALDTVDGFEVVDRPPVATPPPPPPPAVIPPPAVAPPPAVVPPPVDMPPALFLAPPSAAPPSLVSIASRTATVRNGRVSIRVRCPASAAGDCKGLLTLLTAARVRVGSTHYDVRRGATATLKLTMTRASRRLVERTGHLKVVARVSAGSAGAFAQASHRLTLALRASTSPSSRERSSS